MWLKTEHAYPSRAALIENKQKLGEVLVWCQYLAPEDLEVALAVKPAGVRLGDYLVEQGKITVADLYEALSLQQNLPYGKPRPEAVSRPVTRSLPAEVAKRWRVLPYKVAAGYLFVAGSELAVGRDARRSAEILFARDPVSSGDADGIRGTGAGIFAAVKLIQDSNVYLLT